VTSWAEEMTAVFALAKTRIDLPYPAPWNWWIGQTPAETSLDERLRMVGAAMDGGATMDTPFFGT